MHPRDLTPEDWSILTKSFLRWEDKAIEYIRREFRNIVTYYTHKVEDGPYIEINFCLPVHTALEDAFEVPFRLIPTVLREFSPRSLEALVLKFRLEVGK